MFYENLQILCHSHGITLTTLAKDLGLSSGNLSKWKNGGHPRADTAQKIAAYFHVSLDALFSDGSSPSEPPIQMNDIQYALYHETADLSEDTLNRILEFARFAKAEEQKRTRSEKGPKES